MTDRIRNTSRWSGSQRAATLLLVLMLSSGCGVSSYGGLFTEHKEPQYYVVQAGDTLNGIGKKFDVNPQSIALLNGVYDPTKLSIGQRLVISYQPRGEAENTVLGIIPVRARSERSVPPPTSLNGELGYPAGGGHLVSSFGPRGGSFHDGIDIAAEVGTPVFAAHDGFVAYSANGLGGYGNLIILQAPSGMMTVYAHNQKLLVSPGSQIKRGQQIATIGATGKASGPHLHFEVRVKDTRGRYLAVDPLPLFRDAPRRGLRYRINESLTPILARFRRP